MPIVWLINGGGVLFIALSLFSQKATLLPMGLIFVGYCLLFKTLWQMQKASQVSAKKDTTWMLVAFAFGMLSQLLFFADFFVDVYRFALGSGFYLYLFLIVLIVSQKMMPFFTSNTEVQGKADKVLHQHRQRKKYHSNQKDKGSWIWQH